MEMSPKATDPARSVRAPSPRLVLTDRDRVILECCRRFRLLQRDQIMALGSFGSLTRANTRLKALVSVGILSRKQIPVYPGHGSAQALYHLGRGAASVMFGETDWLASHVRQASRWDLRQVEHVLAANQVLVDFHSALHSRTGVQLLSFQTEPELRQIFCDLALVPDGWVSWIEGGVRFNCFVEVDLGTEGLIQWREKVLAYLRYAESGQHQERFGFRGFRVVVLAESRVRLENLRRASEHAGRLFLFSPIGTTNVLDAVWQPAAGDTRLKLSEAR
jgi:DNA-binding HxlR family transcriptional regulator